MSIVIPSEIHIRSIPFYRSGAETQKGQSEDWEEPMILFKAVSAKLKKKVQFEIIMDKSFFFFLSFVFLGQHLRHMEVPRLGV